MIESSREWDPLGEISVGIVTDWGTAKVSEMAVADMTMDSCLRTDTKPPGMVVLTHHISGESRGWTIEDGLSLLRASYTVITLCFLSSHRLIVSVCLWNMCVLLLRK